MCKWVSIWAPENAGSPQWTRDISRVFDYLDCFTQKVSHPGLFETDVVRLVKVYSETFCVCNFLRFCILDEVCWKERILDDDRSIVLPPPSQDVIGRLWKDCQCTNTITYTHTITNTNTKYKYKCKYKYKYKIQPPLSRRDWPIMERLSIPQCFFSWGAYCVQEKATTN